MKLSLRSVISVSFFILFPSLVLGQLEMFYHLLGQSSATSGFIWTGAAGDNKWTTAGNWLGAQVPGTSDKAIFKSASCTGAQCNATVDGPIDVGGVEIQSGFTGTITQNSGNTIHVGAQGWSQVGGTFAGGDANISIDGNFSLTSGTFTSTSATLQLGHGTAVAGDVTMNGGTFNHNNGTVEIGGGTVGGLAATLSLSGISFYNLSLYDRTSTGVNLVFSGTTTITNQFLVNAIVSVAGVDQDGGTISGGGTFDVKGNVLLTRFGLNSSSQDPGDFTLRLSGSSSQNLTGSAEANISALVIASSATVNATNLVKVWKNFNLSSGILASDSTAVLEFTGAASASNTLSGALTYNKVRFSGSNVTHNLSAASWTVDELEFSDSSASEHVLNNGTISVNKNITTLDKGSKGTANIQLVSSIASSVNMANYSAPGIWTVAKTALDPIVTLNGALNLSSAFNITTGSVDMNSRNLNVTGNLSIGSNGALYCNGGTLTVTGSVSVSGIIDCPGYNFIWTGATGDGKWSTAGNWSKNVVPGSGDRAVIGTLCTGANCNINIDSSISVGGVFITPFYPGTITQGSTSTVTVGSIGFQQQGGTYTGSAAGMTFNGPVILNGGTFNASSQTLTVNSHWTVGGTATFNRNTSTVAFTGSWHDKTINPGTVIYNNVTFTGLNVNANLNADMKVYGTLSLGNTGNNYMWINGSNLLASGNVNLTDNGYPSGSSKIRVVGTSNQTITGVATARTLNLEIASTGGTVSLVGTINLYKDYLYTSGTVDAGTSTLLFTGDWLTNNITPGTVNYNNVTFNGNFTYYNLNSDMTVNGTLSMGDVSADDKSINGANLLAKGNVSFISKGYRYSTSKVRVVGSGNQTISCASTSFAPGFEIASTGGVVNLSGTIHFWKDFTYTSGTLDLSTSTISLEGNFQTNTITPGSVVYNNVSFVGNFTNFNVAADMTVNGTLTIGDTSADDHSINGSNLLARGNVTLVNKGFRYGSSKIRIVGSGNQTVTGVASAYLQSFEIASTGGVVTLSGLLRVWQDYTYTSGSIDSSASTLSFEGGSRTNNIKPGAVTYNNVNFIGSWTDFNLNADITVGGTLTIGDQGAADHGIYGSNILARGDVNFTGYGYTKGTSMVRIVGSSNQTLTGAATSNIQKFEIASTGGTVNLAGTLFFFRDFTWTSGTVNAGSSTVVFESDWTTDSITAGSINFNNVTISGCGGTETVVGTLNALGMTRIGSCPYAAFTVNGGTVNALDSVAFFGNGVQGNLSLQMSGATTAVLSRVGPTLPTGIVTINKSASALVTIGSSFSWASTGQDMTVTSGVVDMSGFNLGVNDVLTVGSSGAIQCRGGTLTYGSLVNSGSVDCATSAFTWTGAAADSKWSTASNWQGGVVPGANDVAIFDGSACGTHCNATVDSSINVKGVRMLSNYTGTLTQGGGAVMTLGTFGFFQSGGTFVGANSDLTVGGNLALDGGTFNATSGVLSISNDLLVSASAVFNAGTGTLKMAAGSSGAVISSSNNLQFNNLQLQGTNSAFSLSAGTFTVMGTLTMGDSSSPTGGINSGALIANGNVVYSGQGYVGSATLSLTGEQSATVSVASGASVLSTRLTINKASSSSVTLSSNLSLSNSGQSLDLTSGILSLNGSTLSVNGTLTVASSGSLICGTGSYTAGTTSNSGLIACGSYGFYWTGAGGNANWNTAANWSGGVVPGSGDVAIFGATSCGANCSPTFNVDPNVKGVILLSAYSGTLTQAAGVGLTIGATGWSQSNGDFVGSNADITLNGDLSLNAGSFKAPSTNLKTYKGFAINGGTFNANSGTLLFTGAWMNYTNTNIVKTNGQALQNVTFASDCNQDGWTANLRDVMTVNGDLSLLNKNCGAGFYVNGSSISVKGNLTIQNGGGALIRGTSYVRLTGSSNQTISQIGSSNLQMPLEIASTGGVVSMPSTFAILRDFVYTSGSVTVPTDLTIKVKYLGSMYPVDFKPGSLQFQNVTLWIDCDWDSYNMKLANDLTVNGTLTFSAHGCSNVQWDGSKVQAKGDVVFSTGGTRFVGSTVLSLSGSGNQSLTQSGGQVVSWPIQVASTGGAVNFASNISWNESTQDLSIVSGVLNMAGYNLTVGRNVTNSGTLKKGTSPSCGTLTYGGSYTGSAAICP